VAFVAGRLHGSDFERLQQSIAHQFGPNAARAVVDWRDALNEARNLPEPDKLKRVNEFFNRRITFSDVPTVWGKVDYWATPLETLGKGAADCKGYVIAKYFSLKEIGVPMQKLRLTYVRARIGGPASSITQAHMVLTYYPAPDAEPLVLDNLITDIRPASRRSDLTPVFSFNNEGLWATGTGNQPLSAVDRLSQWKDLLIRMKSEGFDEQGK